MPPWSTRAVVIDIMLAKEASASVMQCNDTCLVLQSVVVDKGSRDDDVSVGLFCEQTGVHEMELGIVFEDQQPPQQAPSSSSVHHCHPMLDNDQGWEDDDDDYDDDDDKLGLDQMDELTGDDEVDVLLDHCSVLFFFVFDL